MNNPIIDMLKAWDTYKEVEKEKNKVLDDPRITIDGSRAYCEEFNRQLEMLEYSINSEFQSAVREAQAYINRDTSY